MTSFILLVSMATICMAGKSLHTPPKIELEDILIAYQEQPMGYNPAPEFRSQVDAMLASALCHCDYDAPNRTVTKHKKTGNLYASCGDGKSNCAYKLLHMTKPNMTIEWTYSTNTIQLPTWKNPVYYSITNTIGNAIGLSKIMNRHVLVISMMDCSMMMKIRDNHEMFNAFIAGGGQNITMVIVSLERKSCTWQTDSVWREWLRRFTVGSEPDNLHVITQTNMYTLTGFETVEGTTSPMLQGMVLHRHFIKYVLANVARFNDNLEAKRHKHMNLD